MLRFLLITACAGLFLGGSPAAAAGDFPWGDFKNRTLKASVVLDDRAAGNAPTTENRVILPGRGLPGRVVATFTGATRLLSREKQELIARWALLENASRDFAPAYAEEFQFDENGRKYWLALQKKMAVQFRHEAQPDQKIELFYFSGIGGLRAGPTWDWALLVTEFQAQK